eukprot:2151140-Rhodomonas_salina.1
MGPSRIALLPHTVPRKLTSSHIYVQTPVGVVSGFAVHVSRFTAAHESDIDPPHPDHGHRRPTCLNRFPQRQQSSERAPRFFLLVARNAPLFHRQNSILARDLRAQSNLLSLSRGGMDPSPSSSV